jgi:hypothetical protein
MRHDYPGETGIEETCGVSDLGETLGETPLGETGFEEGGFKEADPGGGYDAGRAETEIAGLQAQIQDQTGER